MTEERIRELKMELDSAVGDNAKNAVLTKLQVELLIAHQNLVWERKLAKMMEKSND